MKSVFGRFTITWRRKGGKLCIEHQARIEQAWAGNPPPMMFKPSTYDYERIRNENELVGNHWLWTYSPLQKYVSWPDGGKYQYLYRQRKPWRRPNPYILNHMIRELKGAK